MDNLIRELRYAARFLWRRPGYTIAAVVALALGIGASTAIFSVLYAALWRHLPYRDADRLVLVWETKDEEDQNVVNPANYMDWKEQNRVFEDMAANVDSLDNLTGSGEPEEIPALLVTPNFFSVLGVSPMLGRTFTPGQDFSENREVVLSYGLWQRRFGGDRGIIGRKILLDQNQTTVIGVMPKNFQWYIKKGSFIRKAAQVWEPFPITPGRRTRQGRYLTVFARLRPGITPEKAQSEMSVIAARLEKQYKDFNAKWGAHVVPLRNQLTGDVRTALLILSGAVGFVLLIACTNVANLMLARAVSGTKEIAVRSALGAGPFQIARQFFAESLLLALIGGGVGLLLAVWGIEALGALGSLYGMDFKTVSISMPVLVFTLALSILTSVIFGLVPAWQASHWNVQDHLKESSRGNTAVGGNARSILIVSEIALALVLLTGAGLLIQSFSRLVGVNPGFNPKDVLTFRLVLPRVKYPKEPQRIAFFQEVSERLRTLPGVESAGAVSFLPFAGTVSATDFSIEGRPTPAPGQEPITQVFLTDESFFHTMQIALKKGRLFNHSEATEAKRVVLINESLAREFFPNEDPLGKRLKIDMRDEPNPATTVIGIVGDTKHDGLDIEVRPSIYWPYPELATMSMMTFVVRTHGDPKNLMGMVRQVIHDLDPELPLADLRPMKEVVGDTTVHAEFNMILLAILASVALVLAVVGIYGVMSYSVVQRVQEIGVRMALGANSFDVLRLVLKQGGVLVILGTAIGLLLAAALTRWIRSMLFQVSSTDSGTYALVTGFLIAVALIACWIPARRAASVDPMIALRAE